LLWNLKVDLEYNGLLIIDIYCCRRLLQINWTQKVTNADIKKRLDIKEDLILAVLRRKLEVFEHICRMKNNRKIKDVMIGMMKGTGRRGRPAGNGWMTLSDWCHTDVHSLSLKALVR